MFYSRESLAGGRFLTIDVTMLADDVIFLGGTSTTSSSKQLQVRARHADETLVSHCSPTTLSDTDR